MVAQGVSPGLANKRKYSAPEGRQKKPVASPRGYTYLVYDHYACVWQPARVGEISMESPN